MDKTNNNNAIDIVKKRFNENSMLGKELALYNIIINKKFNSDKKADYFITEVLKKRNDLNNSNLRREKYNVIQSIKENFDVNKLLSSKIKNYKV